MYIKVLHTDAADASHTEAFEHRCLHTQKHLHRDTLTYTRLYTQKLLHTENCPQKPLDREAFSRRSFCTKTRAISAEGCPRTNKTCISPHVWASDTPQKVTFRKPPPGCPCRQRAWTLVELLCGNSSVTISVQMTLQEFCRSSIRGGSPASQLLCE